MANQRKTWQQKLYNGFPAKTIVQPKDFADVPAGATMFVANGEAVDAYIRSIPAGTHTSLQQMRKDLAAINQAAYTCPVMAGLFLRISAEAAWEALQSGTSANNVTPFWRMIDHKSPAAKKLSFGTDFVRQQREAEGLKW